MSFMADEECLLLSSNPRQWVLPFARYGRLEENMEGTFFALSLLLEDLTQFYRKNNIKRFPFPVDKFGNFDDFG